MESYRESVCSASCPLRRWPIEARAGLSEGVPAFQAVDGNLVVGKALPVRKVRLTLGDHDLTTTVQPSDQDASFTVTLRASDKTQLKTYLLDADGNERAGAYFAYVLRK